MSPLFRAALLAGAWLFAGLCAAQTPARKGKVNDFPTSARVQYVEDCMGRTRTLGLAGVYKCSCVVDRLAAHFSYDQFVEAGMYAHYSSLGGDQGDEFRDPPGARNKANQYRKLEGDSYRACGLPPPLPNEGQPAPGARGAARPAAEQVSTTAQPRK